MEIVCKIFTGDEKMEIKNIKIEDITPNPWNPNEMTEAVFHHLKKEYKRIGYIQPVVVRPNKGKFEVIDGEHRYKAAKEFGLKSIKCVVVEMDDNQAKITTINMNKIKGTDNPLKLYNLIQSLQEDIKIEDLSTTINIPKSEIDMIGMMNDLPDIKEEDQKSKHVITFTFENEAEYKRILSMVLTNQFDWKGKKPNTNLLIRSIDHFTTIKSD